MKKTHIIGMVMIVAAIGLLASLSGEVSSYSTFAQAMEEGGKVQIVGQLSKDKEMVFNPEKDPNYFSFYMKDSAEEERKVVLLAGKPQDFEKSESLVLTGAIKGEDFIATEMLMKCPSKYKDEEIYIKSNGTQASNL